MPLCVCGYIHECGVYAHTHAHGAQSKNAVCPSFLLSLLYYLGQSLSLNQDACVFSQDSNPQAPAILHSLRVKYIPGTTHDLLCGIRTQVLMLVSKHFYPLRHLTGPPGPRSLNI